MKSTHKALLVAALLAAALNLRPAIASVAPLLETLRLELSMTAAAASLLTSIPLLCMGIFSPLSARLGGRYGIERVLGWALLLIGGGTALRWFAESAGFIMATALLAGAGIAAAGPLLSGFIKRHFPGEAPFMISLFAVALTLGAAIASGFTAPLSHLLASWNVALGSWSLLAFLAVPIWMLAARGTAVRAEAGRTSGDAMKLPWTSGRVWLLTASFGLTAMLFYSIVAWLPPILIEEGLSPAYAVQVLTVFTLMQVPAGLLLPVILKRFPSRLKLLLIFSFLQLLGLVLLYGAASPWAAGVLLGIGAGALFPLNLLLPVDAAATPQEAAAWSSMIQSAGYAIGAAGPLLVGMLHDGMGGFGPAVSVLVLLTLAMMAVQAAVVPRL